MINFTGKVVGNFYGKKVNKKGSVSQDWNSISENKNKQEIANKYDEYIKQVEQRKNEAQQLWDYLNTEAIQKKIALLQDDLRITMQDPQFPDEPIRLEYYAFEGVDGNPVDIIKKDGKFICEENDIGEASKQYSIDEYMDLILKDDEYSRACDDADESEEVTKLEDLYKKIFPDGSDEIQEGKYKGCRTPEANRFYELIEYKRIEVINKLAHKYKEERLRLLGEDK